MFIWNLNQLFAGAPNPDESFYVFTVDLDTFGISDIQYINLFPYEALDTGIYNTSMFVMPVWADALGLTEGDSRFNYYVESNSRESLSDWGDITEVHSFDPGAPAIDTAPGGFLELPLNIEAYFAWM